MKFDKTKKLITYKETLELFNEFIKSDIEPFIHTMFNTIQTCKFNTDNFYTSLTKIESFLTYLRTKTDLPYIDLDTYEEFESLGTILNPVLFENHPSSDQIKQLLEERFSVPSLPIMVTLCGDFTSLSAPRYTFNHFLYHIKAEVLNIRQIQLESEGDNVTLDSDNMRYCLKMLSMNVMMFSLHCYLMSMMEVLSLFAPVKQYADMD